MRNGWLTPPSATPLTCLPKSGPNASTGNQPRSPPWPLLLVSSDDSLATSWKSAPPAMRARRVSILALAAALSCWSVTRTRMCRPWYSVMLWPLAAALASRTSTSLSSWKPLGPRIGPTTSPAFIWAIICANALGISSSERQPRSPPSSALGLSE
ncbi:hypothetical protein D3C72_1810390 [compost metagenome]